MMLKIPKEFFFGLLGKPSADIGWDFTLFLVSGCFLIEVRGGNREFLCGRETGGGGGVVITDHNEGKIINDVTTPIFNPSKPLALSLGHQNSQNIS